MKTLTKFLIACLCLTACVQTIDTDYPIVNNKGEYAIQFGTRGTRASLNTVSETGYDEFSLYVWNSNNDTIMNPYKIEALSPSKYIYATLPNQELKYFNNTANWYDFTGVIPTTHKQTVIADTIKVDTVKAFVVDDNRVSGTLIAESPEEFLWTYKRVNKADYPNVVDLNFKHQNALIYLGFSSDRDDTKLLDYVPGNPAIPAVNDTIYSWNVKSGSGISPRSTSPTTVPITDEDVTYINSWFSTDIGTWPTSSTAGYFIVTPVTNNIPDAYKTICNTLSGKNILVFDALKYLNEKYPGIYWGGNWATDATQGQIIVHLDKPNQYHRAWSLNPFQNEIETITEITPAIAGKQAIEGIRVFSADSTGINNLPADTLYCVHVPHTIIADAYIDSTGCVLKDRVTSDSVIQFSLPTTTTLNATPVWSATTYYGLPGDANFNFIVVKISYTYNGVTSYDVRVPIKLPAGGLQPGKYYKYEIKITSTYNGTNDPDEAKDEKDEILIEGLHPIVVNLGIEDYTQGANQQIKI